MSQAAPLTRRSFARFLAGSPLLPLLGFSACAPGESEDATARATIRELSDLIESPDDAINVFDFRDVARQTLPPAHYGYLATGVDGDETLRANREGFGRFDLRAFARQAEVLRTQALPSPELDEATDRLFREFF